MNPVTSILPIAGVPDELIRILNERFRALSESGAAAADAVKPGIFFSTNARPDANGTASSVWIISSYPWWIWSWYSK
jgi:hypothetical protein